MHSNKGYYQSSDLDKYDQRCTLHRKVETWHTSKTFKIKYDIYDFIGFFNHKISAGSALNQIPLVVNRPGVKDINCYKWY